MTGMFQKGIPSQVDNQESRIAVDTIFIFARFLKDILGVSIFFGEENIAIVT